MKSGNTEEKARFSSVNSKAVKKILPIRPCIGIIVGLIPMNGLFRVRIVWSDLKLNSICNHMLKDILEVRDITCVLIVLKVSMIMVFLLMIFLYFFDFVIE